MVPGVNAPWTDDIAESFTPEQNRVYIRGKKITEKIRILSESEFQLAKDSVNRMGGYGARPFLYLACPYSHDNPKVREDRFNLANQISAKLILKGHLVFSPISHTHPITATPPGLPFGWETWAKFDKAILQFCHTIAVALIDGWAESVGVKAEIEIGKKMRIKIRYVDREGDLLE